MAWYLAPALAVGRAEVNRRWPNRDKASDGTIGDTAHQATRSDHNPNSRESVNAWDMDKDGVDVWEVIGAFQRHPSSHYWIYNRQIADKDSGWRRQPYSGPNPHTEHVHFSIRQSAAAEQDQRPWGLLEGEFMAGISDTDQQALIWRVEALVSGRATVAGGPTKGEPVVSTQRQLALAGAIAALDDEVAAKLREEFGEIDAAVADVRGAVEAVPELTVTGLLQRPLGEAASALISTLGPAHAEELAQAILASVSGAPNHPTPDGL